MMRKVREFMKRHIDRHMGDDIHVATIDAILVEGDQALFMKDLVDFYENVIDKDVAALMKAIIKSGLMVEHQKMEQAVEGVQALNKIRKAQGGMPNDE